MSESDIITLLANYGDHQRRYELMLPNVFIQHDSEADFFAVRKSGLCDEFEIKVSRSDFLADKKKFVRYRDLELHEYEGYSWKDRGNHPSTKLKHQALIDGDLCINYFWYVVPEGIATVEEIPVFAGLMIINANGQLRVKKRPVKLHREKLSIEERYRVARKSTHRYWKLRNVTG